MRKCLANFGGNNVVFQYISEEFAGLFHFVQLGWKPSKNGVTKRAKKPSLV